MNANPILLQKKYARVVDLFAKKEGITLSDDYLVGDLCVEYQKTRQQ